MDYRLPFYMAYPMPLLYDDERIERQDYEYMKTMYPQAAKTLLPYVEEECDRMEYEGSMVYDDYPDQLQLRLMCKRVCDNVAKQEIVKMEEWVKDLISVMLYQELYKRRCDRRRCRRKYY